MNKPKPGVNGWYRIVGMSEPDDLWIKLETDGPEELKDGRWLEREAAFGRGDQYPAKWWFRQQEPSSASRRADVLWGEVAAFAVVSERFVEALRGLNVSDWWGCQMVCVSAGPSERNEDGPHEGNMGRRLVAVDVWC